MADKPTIQDAQDFYNLINTANPSQEDMYSVSTYVRERFRRNSVRDKTVRLQKINEECAGFDTGDAWVNTIKNDQGADVSNNTDGSMVIDEPEEIDPDESLIESGSGGNSGSGSGGGTADEDKQSGDGGAYVPKTSGDSGTVPKAGEISSGFTGLYDCNDLTQPIDVTWEKLVSGDSTPCEGYNSDNIPAGWECTVPSSISDSGSFVVPCDGTPVTPTVPDGCQLVVSDGGGFVKAPNYSEKALTFPTGLSETDGSYSLQGDDIYDLNVPTVSTTALPSGWTCRERNDDKGRPMDFCQCVLDKLASSNSFAWGGQTVSGYTGWGTGSVSCQIYINNDNYWPLGSTQTVSPSYYLSCTGLDVWVPNDYLGYGTTNNLGQCTSSPPAPVCSEKCTDTSYYESEGDPLNPDLYWYISLSPEDQPKGNNKVYLCEIFLAVIENAYAGEYYISNLESLIGNTSTSVTSCWIGQVGGNPNYSVAYIYYGGQCSSELPYFLNSTETCEEENNLIQQEECEQGYYVEYNIVCPDATGEEFCFDSATGSNKSSTEPYTTCYDTETGTWKDNREFLADDNPYKPQDDSFINSLDGYNMTLCDGSGNQVEVQPAVDGGVITTRQIGGVDSYVYYEKTDDGMKATAFGDKTNVNYYTLAGQEIPTP